MNTKRVPLNSELNALRNECSVEALSERLFERTLSIAEVVELSEKCSLWDIEKKVKKTYSSPFSFAVPTNQHFASVSRMVE
jgi:hypothetical protein